MQSTNPQGAPENLRDLDEDEFRRRYGSDRFTAGLLTKRFTYAVEHMSAAFHRQAFSPIVAQFYDFSCTISGPPELDYTMSAVSDSLLLFVGTMPDVVRCSIEEYGPENVRDGDVIIANDPFRIGGHPNDLAFIKPVFHEGRIVAFVSMRVHQLDIGGVAVGGFSALKKNAYENGLVVPPMLLWSAGVPVKSTFALLFDNTRLGSLIKPDIFSTKSQLDFGERLVRDNIERYGLEAVHGAMVYGADASAELMREAISKLPDGDYTGSAVLDADGMDADESYVVKVTVRKRGHQIEADLSGSSRQAQTCINASFVDTKNAIGCALSMLLAPGIPFTSANWRNIDVVSPPGSIVSSMPPDGAVMFYWEPGACILAAVFKALNPALGPDAMAGDSGSSNAHNGGGLRADGSAWVSASQVGGENGPWGATKVGDGDSYVVPLMINALIPGFEPMEAASPFVLLANEPVMDSGGAGYNRGGAALRRETYWLTNGEHYITPLRTKDRAGFGAYGGADGGPGAIWRFSPEVADIPNRRGPVPLDESFYAQSDPIGGQLNPDTKCLDPDGVYFHYASEPVWRFQAGTVMRVMTNAAGGWGDPFTREIDRVVMDVRNGYVSIEGAARDYGVVITGDAYFDPEGLVVDVEATERLRAGHA